MYEKQRALLLQNYLCELKRLNQSKLSYQQRNMKKHLLQIQLEIQLCKKSFRFLIVNSRKLEP